MWLELVTSMSELSMRALRVEGVVDAGGHVARDRVARDDDVVGHAPDPVDLAHRVLGRLALEVAPHGTAEGDPAVQDLHADRPFGHQLVGVQGGGMRAPQ